jgi:hypothetical protein
MGSRLFWAEFGELAAVNGPVLVMSQEEGPVLRKLCHEMCGKICKSVKKVAPLRHALTRVQYDIHTISIQVALTFELFRVLLALPSLMNTVNNIFIVVSIAVCNILCCKNFSAAE